MTALASGWNHPGAGITAGRRRPPLGRDVTIAIVGAGARGRAYADLMAATGSARIVAVADPSRSAVAAVAGPHGLAPSATFPSWRDLADAPRLADAAVVSVPDREHAGAAEALMDLGYDVLLEKPIATTEEDCVGLADCAARNDVFLAVCHVLRYTAQVRALLDVVASGRIGDVVGVQHLEPVGYWHFAHSFVRGNWRNTAESSFFLLAKACHDVDLVTAIVGRPVSRVSSFGSLSHFRAESRPAGAADRCLDCSIEPTCPYSAVRLYRAGLHGDRRKAYFTAVAAGVPIDELTEEAVTRALREGDYGRCVYASDNDVVDHQVVSLEFDGGATASITVTAFTPMGLRRTVVFGTRGQVTSDGERLVVDDFLTESSQTIEVASTNPLASGESSESSLPGSRSGRPDGSAAAGHGGGDAALVGAFIRALTTGDTSVVPTTVAESLAGHRVTFAAERARLSGQVVSL